jgi:transglutaminase/protease-like cytokinesis protein 3
MKNIIKIIILVLFVLFLGFYIFWTKTTNNMKNYDALVEAINEGYLNYDDEVNIFKFNFSDEEILVNAIHDAGSDIYYASENIKYLESEIGITKVYLDYNYKNNGKVDIAKSTTIQIETNKVVDEIINEIELNQSQSLIALEIHDKLISMITYDYQNYLEDTLPPESYTAYGALVKNVAVCDGYSKSYMVLLDKAGIENHYVGSEAMNHSWVIAKLDGRYFHIDITWDDPVSLYGLGHINTMTHDYFMLSDVEISKDHYGYSDKLPKCE